MWLNAISMLVIAPKKKKMTQKRNRFSIYTDLDMTSAA